MPFGTEFVTSRFVAGFSILEDWVIWGSGSEISAAIDDSTGEFRNIVNKSEGCEEECNLEVIGQFPFVQEPFNLSCND